MIFAEAIDSRIFVPRSHAPERRAWNIFHKFFGGCLESVEENEKLFHLDEVEELICDLERYFEKEIGRFVIEKIVVEETSEDVELKTIFNGLAKKWIEETGGASLTMRRYADSSYQSILVLGGKEPKVVDLILHELQRSPDMWFEALRRLTNEDPAKGVKSFEDATKAWLKWGRDKKRIA